MELILYVFYITHPVLALPRYRVVCCTTEESSINKLDGACRSRALMLIPQVNLSMFARKKNLITTKMSHIFKCHHPARLTDLIFAVGVKNYPNFWKFYLASPPIIGGVLLNCAPTVSGLGIAVLTRTLLCQPHNLTIFDQ